MPVLNRIAGLQEEMTAWRRHLHARPELMFDLPETAAFVSARLREFGCDAVDEGMAETGVVAVIRGRASASGRVVALRADMDALPIHEGPDRPHRSQVPGRMHACGHDGHTAMLLGAAKYLAETRNFDGTAILVFQPAEEAGSGGRVMVEQGLMERYGIHRVFGLHNAPGAPLGFFGMRTGPLTAAVDDFDVTVTGRGTHAADPHLGIDPVPAAAAVVLALQQVASRNTDPLAAIVLSVTRMEAGTAYNVIPETARLGGTVRTLDARVRDRAERRLSEIAHGIAAAHGCRAEVEYRRGDPSVVNHAAEVELCARVATDVAGEGMVLTDVAPVMGAEDFSHMLEARPGAYVFLGAGEGAGLHHPDYDFNDEILPIGATYWARLAETAMPLR